MSLKRWSFAVLCISGNMQSKRVECIHIFQGKNSRVLRGYLQRCFSLLLSSYRNDPFLPISQGDFHISKLHSKDKVILHTIYILHNYEYVMLENIIKMNSSILINECFLFE